MRKPIDGRKIAELRLLLVRDRLGMPADEETLRKEIDPLLGELLALAEVTCKIRALFPGEPWPQWLSEDQQVGVLSVRVRDAMRGLETLEKVAGVSPESVRRMLAEGSSSPQLATVLSMLRPLGMGLAVQSREASVPTREDVLAGELAHYGAPLYGVLVGKGERVRGPETVLSDGVVMARESGTVARAMPCAFWACREKLDLPLLRHVCEERGQGRALGFFLDLTRELSGGGSLFEEQVSALRGRYARTPLLSRPEQFFRPTTRRERALAELCTSDVARRWCFRMNMDLECFASMFRKATS